MSQLYAGTSGWAYAGWKPDFYPAKLAQKKFLNHYASQLNTVEVNFTFRQLVKESTLNNWIADTPESFRFGVKAHQMLTHIKRLKGTADFLPRFVSSLEPLATPDETTADFAYYRYRKASYSADERKQMLQTLRGHTEHGRDVFAYFKHEETPEGVLYARDLLTAAVK